MVVGRKVSVGVAWCRHLSQLQTPTEWPATTATPSADISHEWARTVTKQNINILITVILFFIIY